MDCLAFVMCSFPIYINKTHAKRKSCQCFCPTQSDFIFRKGSEFEKVQKLKENFFFQIPFLVQMLLGLSL